ncbi:MAG TPA: alpha/beta fold hydrolase [Marinobacter sp.]|nr:alpha/beta fold hydrolase [Marinobacter sp.]
MIKRIYIGLSLVAILLIGLAIYYLYAPSPQTPEEPIERFAISVDNRARNYSVYYPSNLKPGASVLFALHPSMSSGDEMRGWVGRTLERFAAKENAVIVYPDGYEGHFNDCRKAASYSARTLNIDDVVFIRRIVDQLVIEKGIDPKAVYAIGYSNGGHLAFRLALEAPDLVTGIVAIAANLPAADNMVCDTLTSPARFIGLIEGTQDPINPYEGGEVTLFGFGNRGNVLSAGASAKWFAQTLGVELATTKPPVEISGHVVQQKDWKSADARISLITIEGGGHTIPQANFRFRRILGQTLQADAVLESAMQLFKRR